MGAAVGELRTDGADDGHALALQHLGVEAGAQPQVKVDVDQPPSDASWTSTAW